MQGAIFHHLNACDSIMRCIATTMRTRHDDLALFLIEAFLYLEFISKNVSLPLPLEKGASSGTAHHVPLSFSLELRKTTPCRGFFFGYAHHLFELIPQVNQFARKPAKTSVRCEDEELVEEFRQLEIRIVCWEPHMVDSLPGLASAEKPNHDLITGGLLYQMALLIYLRLALNGPGWPKSYMRTQIDCTISEALMLFASLSPASPSWTSLLWPFLTIGSCITSPRSQNLLMFTLVKSDDKMPSCRGVMNILRWMWEEPDVDGTFYGPFGIEAIMRKHGVRFSLG
jgi:hypothetical protein